MTPTLAQRLAEAVAEWDWNQDDARTVEEVVRQSLSGYCVVKREVLLEAIEVMENAEADPMLDGMKRYELQQFLTKLHEILGGKQ